MKDIKVFPNFWQALLYNYIAPLIILLPVLLFIFKGIVPEILLTINDNFGHLLTIPILFFFLWKSKIKISWSDFGNLNIRKILIIIALTALFELVFYGTIYFSENLLNRHYPPFSSQINGYFHVIHALIVTPVIEEILYRRIFLHQFLKQYSPWLAIILSSFLFAMPHVPAIVYPELLVPFLFSGLFLGLIYYKTQSVSLCIISHFVMNALTYLPIGSIFK